MAEKFLVHDKTKFAKPPQEGYLGLRQIRNDTRNKKNVVNIKKSLVGTF